MDYDVVVAGAGPVGLLLACELRLGGARVLVVERETEPPRSRFGSMGARAVNAPSVHALHLRGLLPEVERAAAMWLGGGAGLPEVEPGDTGERPDVFVGHFAGIGIRVDRLRPPGPGEEFLGAGVIAQGDLEAIFERRAAELGVEVQRGVSLTAFESDADGVTVHIGRPIRTGWLVGADGGRSTVRRLAGIDFPGVDPVFTGRQAIVDLDDPGKLVADGWQAGEHGSYVVGGWDDGSGPPRVHTVEYEVVPDRDAPVTAEEIQASLRRVSGTDVRVTRLHVATRYADTTRQAETYRRGRVLLCGDAAHVHSPAGGQGMNLGLGDAVNLGWKLALVARGVAPDALLDTYTAERHPIGEWVQRWSMAQTALSTPRGPRADALREVLADLLDTQDGATYVVSKIGGGWQHYDLPGDFPLIGHRVPDLPLSDGTTLAPHFRSGRAVLLDTGTGAAEAAAGWESRVELVTATPLAFPDQKLAALIRPDGHMAWAAVGPDPEGLREALTTWLGPPA
ncbi:FAD-dependent monooxygenase [Amycolatopsis sp. WQ 127309]|uniref:FAD-dependent monooxygenase n=1 Tax=Amycolatopsis sp. WQ 127309 TaxID=2932773 RepID=UPI001FF28009|nr:FAD-dependent monooxygenase [Amycolatopsis sp. WQ 127309]UOZ03244.1 FAD-dependent monooxygenase [Amycolatopsis sp. WQ 127309]